METVTNCDGEMVKKPQKLGEDFFGIIRNIKGKQTNHSPAHNEASGLVGAAEEAWGFHCVLKRSRGLILPLPAQGRPERS